MHISRSTRLACSGLLNTSGIRLTATCQAAFDVVCRCRCEKLRTNKAGHGIVVQDDGSSAEKGLAAFTFSPVDLSSARHTSENEPEPNCFRSSYLSPICRLSHIFVKLATEVAVTTTANIQNYTCQV